MLKLDLSTIQAALLGALLMISSAPASTAQVQDSPAAQNNTEERPPAVPLVVHDPDFSLWSMSNKLTGQNTRHPTGVDQPLDGLMRIDGARFRYMGVQPRQMFALPETIPAMQQVALTLRPLHRKYRFEQAGVRLEVQFFTQSFPRNLDVLSRPVTYLTWTVQATDGKPHDVDLMLDVDPRIAVNEDVQAVTWGRSRTKDLTLLNVGSQEQRELHQGGDNMRIDWGYFHLIAPNDEHVQTALSYAAWCSSVRTALCPRRTTRRCRAPHYGAIILPISPQPSI